MSWKEDEIFDVYDYEFELSDDLNDPSVWVDIDKVTHEWEELSIEHLRSIVNGLEAGNKYYGQLHKLSRAKRELITRK
jgi:hypothetical protein